jgi:hypothetical protein
VPTTTCRPIALPEGLPFQDGHPQSRVSSKECLTRKNAYFFHENHIGREAFLGLLEVV